MLNSHLKPSTIDDAVAGDVDPAAVHEAAAWADQLQRTLKVSRLYDLANPTVVRFQQDLATSLAAFVGRRGALTLHVTSTALSYGGRDVLSARSHEDNLAGAFHRDGIRALTLEPGIEASEVDSLVEQILRVTGPAAGDDDLVTLLWDANLPHVIIETVPLEGEADGGAEDEAERTTGSSWPRQPSSSEAPPAATAQPPGATAMPEGTATAGAASRSDDWETREDPPGLERSFRELESAAPAEVGRFQREHESRSAEPIPTGVARVLQDCLLSDLTAADRDHLAGFAPRVLREALGQGDWPAASTLLRLTRSCTPGWSVEEFARELCESPSITTRAVVACLDRQDKHGVEAFLELARGFGPALAEWLMRVLAESQQMQVRRPLARTIGELLPGHPEAMIPWLSDSRWYVVRNAVHILGWIGAEESVNYLRVPARHPEMRVRREVVAALGQTSQAAARPILMDLADGAEPPLFVAIVRQLTLDDHASIQDWLLSLLRSDAFPRRSEDERRAVFQALATRGDAALTDLEAELNRGGLLSRRPEPDRTAIALCLARIGTPAARAILELGTRSRNAAVRKACSIAAASRGGGDE